MTEVSRLPSDSEIERIKIQRHTDEYLFEWAVAQGKKATLSEIRTDFDRFLIDYIKEIFRRKGGTLHGTGQIGV
jgi:hypothetical protein